MVPNKQFFVYLEKKLRANKQFMNEEEEEEEEQGGKYKNPLYIIHCNFCGYRGSKGEINNFLIFFGVCQHKLFSVYKHLIFVVYKHQYYCVYKRSIMGSF